MTPQDEHVQALQERREFMMGHRIIDVQPITTRTEFDQILPSWYPCPMIAKMDAELATPLTGRK